MALTGVVAGIRDAEISSRLQSFARRDIPFNMPTNMSVGAHDRVTFAGNKHQTAKASFR